MQILGKAGNNYFKVFDRKGKVHAIALFDQRSDASRDEALSLARNALSMAGVPCHITAWRRLDVELQGVTRDFDN